MISMSELRRSIAASDLEIETALNAVFAVEFDGPSPCPSLLVYLSMYVRELTVRKRLSYVSRVRHAPSRPDHFDRRIRVPRSQKTPLPRYNHIPLPERGPPRMHRMRPNPLLHAPHPAKLPPPPSLHPRPHKNHPLVRS